MASFLGVAMEREKKELIKKIGNLEKERGKLEHISFRDPTVVVKGKKVYINGKEYKLKDLDISTLKYILSLFTSIR